MAQKHKCECNACVYQRWFNNNKLRKKIGMKLLPRPVYKDRRTRENQSEICPCPRCQFQARRTKLKRLGKRLKKLEVNK